MKSPAEEDSHTQDYIGNNFLNSIKPGNVDGVMNCQVCSKYNQASRHNNKSQETEKPEEIIGSIISHSTLAERLIDKFVQRKPRNNTTWCGLRQGEG